MRIAIINMPCRTDAKPNIVPLGIYYVGSAIRKYLPAEHAEIKYVDLNLLRPISKEYVEETLSGFLGCDIYMLSGLITTLAWQRFVSKYIRSKEPGAKIISGGGLATNIGQTLTQWIEIDSVAIGEGESTVGPILRDFSAGSLQLVYKGDPVRDLDSWPMDWAHVQGLGEYMRNPIWGAGAGNSSWSRTDQTSSLNMVTSRGCPMSCGFCSREATGGRIYRARSAKSVIEEVRYLVKCYGAKFIGFMDDNMAVDRERMIEICDGLRPFAEEGLRWGCHARFDMYYNLPGYMSASGCRHIGFGAESASEDILKLMNKKQSVKRMREMIQRCREAGIHPNCTWIMGWPGERLNDLRKTIRFIIEHAPENQQLFVATAYPGTDLWGQVQDKVIGRYGSVEAYVEALGDATLPLMNYSAMRDSAFHAAYEYIQSGQLGRIL